MKILFITYEEPTNPTSFPLGVGLLSAVLKAKGHEVHGLYVREDLATAGALDAIAAQVKAHAPQLLAYSCTSPAFASIARIAGKLHQEIGVPAICGGAHPTLYPRETLAVPGIDYVCVGEGEVVLPAFVAALENGTDCSLLPGIWSEDDRGGTVTNELPGLVQDLDALPWIDFDVFGADFIRTLTQDGWLRHLTSRGCPYSCSYCHTPMFRKVFAEGIGVPPRALGYVRSRGCDSIVEELVELVARYDLRVLNFMDDLFCMKKDWVLEFCDRFRQRLPHHVGYSIQTHLQHLDEEIIAALRKSRCLRVAVGVESASQRILKLLNRHTTPSAMRQKLVLLQQARFPLGTWTLNMVGIPTETQEEMQETLALSAGTMMERVKVNIMAPYPKSALYDFCVQENLFRHEADAVRFVDRSVTKLKFPDRELAFLEKFFDVGHWYLNVAAPLGLDDIYRPLIAEVERVGPGQWSRARQGYLKTDAAISEALEKQSRRYYTAVLKGKVTSNAFGLNDVDSRWVADAPQERRSRSDETHQRAGHHPAILDCQWASKRAPKFVSQK